MLKLFHKSADTPASLLLRRTSMLRHSHLVHKVIPKWNQPDQPLQHDVSFFELYETLLQVMSHRDNHADCSAVWYFSKLSQSKSHIVLQGGLDVTRASRTEDVTFLTFSLKFLSINHFGLFWAFLVQFWVTDGLKRRFRELISRYPKTYNILSKIGPIYNKMKLFWYWRWEYKLCMN